MGDTEMIKLQKYQSYRHCVLDLIYQGCVHAGRIFNKDEVPKDPAIITVFDSTSLAVELDTTTQVYYSVDKIHHNNESNQASNVIPYN